MDQCYVRYVDMAGLVEQLAAPDRDVRRSAADALVAAGPVAVGPVLEVLCDEDSPVEWGTSAMVLRRIGDAAFAPLAEVIASTPSREVARRAGWAFAGLNVSDGAMYAAALRHSSPGVRKQAAYALQVLESDALPYAQALTGLLADPDPEVRQRAVWAFSAIGAGTVPVLRQARRMPGPGRRTALTALAETGGWDALEPRDQELVDRLIRIKIPREVPAPMHLCGCWYAVPVADQAAVLEAFGLSGARSATMRLGESAWNYDHHHHWAGREHARCARMYVTPFFSGWTLVFGELPEVAHAGHGEAHNEAMRRSVLEHCRELSAAFGAAHWYGASCGDDWTAWCLAEGGDIVRYYDIEEPRDQIGPAHPAESGYLLPHEDGFPDDAFDGINPNDTKAFTARYLQVKEALAIPDPAHATTIAARTSVNPAALGPHTSVTGHGVIAATECGRSLASPPGALKI